MQKEKTITQRNDIETAYFELVEDGVELMEKEFNRPLREEEVDIIRDIIDEWLNEYHINDSIQKWLNEKGKELKTYFFGKKE